MCQADGYPADVLGDMGACGSLLATRSVEHRYQSPIVWTTLPSGPVEEPR